MLRFNNFIILKVNVLDKFAARLNSFKIGHQDYWPGKNNINTLIYLVELQKQGLMQLTLISDHLENINLQELKETLKQLNIHLNGLAMRYYFNQNLN